MTIAETRANEESLNENIFSDNEFNFEIFSTDEPFDINFELLEETYWNAGQKLSDCIVDIRCNVLSKLNDKEQLSSNLGKHTGWIRGTGLP